MPLLFRSSQSDSVRLSDLIQNPRMSGLAFESAEVLESLHRDYERWTELKWDLLCPKACASGLESPSSPLCSLIELGRERRKGTQRELRQIRNRRIQAGVQSMRKAKLKELEDLSESDLISVFRKLPRYRDVHKAASLAITQETCLPSALFLAFGIRMEAEFPKQEFKDKTTHFYERAIQCGNDASAVQAAYRLGLMQIWEENYEKADSILSRIQDHPLVSDFRMRTLYWRNYCARKLGRIGQQFHLSDLLVREYPLSLHALLVPASEGELQEPWDYHSDPEVHLRSTVDPSLTPWIQTIEFLISKGHVSTAEALLERAQNRALKTEPSFQIYWATLLQRLGNELNSFQLLASAFKMDSDLLSENTLGLMYPLIRWEEVEELSQTLDPFLVLSIIRQESAFDEDARSPAGAQGLMQLQPPTARRFQRVSKRQLYDPRVNIKIGVTYFSYLLQQNQGEAGFALAAYNAGPQRMKQWLKRYPIENRILFFDLLPIRETRDYVSSIARNYFWYHRLYGYKRKKP